MSVGKKAKVHGKGTSAQWKYSGVGERHSVSGIEHFKEMRSRMVDDDPQLSLSAPEYVGALVTGPSGRVVISPNGERYWWQRPAVGGSWTHKGGAGGKTLSALLKKLPDDLAVGVSHLPENAVDVPRSWASLIADGAAAMAAAQHGADQYIGTIARAELVRISVAPGSVAYLLHVRKSEDDPWMVGGTFVSSLALREVFCRADGDWPEAWGTLVRSDDLFGFVSALPENPRDALSQDLRGHRLFVSSQGG